MATVLADLDAKGLLTIRTGATVGRPRPDRKLPPCLLKKSDGATIYATRDIASAVQPLRGVSTSTARLRVDKGRAYTSAWSRSASGGRATVAGRSRTSRSEAGALRRQEGRRRAGRRGAAPRRARRSRGGEFGEGRRGEETSVEPRRDGHVAR